jgi:ribosomal protein S18 acetylase RimI-like enzyme
LRGTTDWDQLDDLTVASAIGSDLFNVCIYHESLAVGCGRLIGDGAIYFYIQDVIVLPQFQKMGIGKMIIDDIMIFLKSIPRESAFVGLMAAEGAKEFYQKFGFSARGDDSPGMYLTL